MVAIPVLPWLPGLLVALFAFYCGTFSGVGFPTSVVAASALILISFLGWPHWRRPLGSGTATAWLAWALLLAVAASWWASPVARAGSAVLVLLPIYGILPAALARCWSSRAARRIGLRVLMAAIAAVALSALVGHLILDDPRASWPIGHHNLLAGWIVSLLPLLLSMRQETGLWRYAAACVTVLSVATLLLTGSLSGLLALTAAAIVLILPSRRRWLGLAILGLVAFAAWPRLGTIVAGQDRSLEARLVYGRGAWAGVEARPALGWGPGSTPWTLPMFVEPIPGVNPAGEIVSDPHNLPLRLAYELGLGGALLVLGLGIAIWRKSGRDLASAVDPDLLLGARASLAGFVVWSLGGAPLEVQAIPTALALVLGASIAGAGQEPADRRGPWWIAIGSACLLVPSLMGQAHWDRAAVGEGEGQALEEAIAKDGAFPLYRSRLGTARSDNPSTAGDLLVAAQGAPGSAVLWLRAGEAAMRADLPWTADALQRACALDPLGPFAPFLLLQSDPSHPEAADAGARALLADLRLGAATFWQDHRALLDASIARLETWPGVEEGWRADAVLSLRSMRVEEGSLALLRLVEDARLPTSSSVFAFRRLPWTAELVAIEVDLERAAQLDLPPAYSLPSTGREALSLGCRGADQKAEVSPSPQKLPWEFE